MCSFLLLLRVLSFLITLHQAYTADCRCRACDLANPIGPYCDILVDFCSTNPCQNGGRCINTATTFRCECGTSFWGDLCEIPYLLPTFINSPADLPSLTYAVPYYTTVFPSLTVSPLHGQPPFTFQWFLDGWEINGEESSRFNVTVFDIQYNPSSTLWVVATDIRGNWAESTHCIINPYCLRPGTCICSPECVFGSCIDNNLCNCTGSLHHGIRCEMSDNPCLSSPCNLYNGACMPASDFTSYTCQCQAGWDQPTCNTEVNECASNPCQNGASCGDFFNYYVCTCVQGYTGDQCQVEIDECASSPCLNGGECMNLINRFECFCPQGWDGTLCENEINECLSSPCQHGGYCHNYHAGYTCECDLQWNGTWCEQDFNECIATFPCQNGATCQNTWGNYTCQCAAGYSGRNCQTNINECASGPCMNGASCTDGINSFTCACAAGFSGRICQTNINECASGPCMNGGTCVDGIDSFSCICTSDFAGAVCQNNINECRSLPCKNGATCTNGVNSFTCSCAPGYTDTLCQTNINECASLPCQNGGTCADGVNSFSCACVTGYNGILCQTNIDDCVSSPCVNGGTCVDGVNSYTCSCHYGFSGRLCQTEIGQWYGPMEVSDFQVVPGMLYQSISMSSLPSLSSLKATARSGYGKHLFLPFDPETTTIFYYANADSVAVPLPSLGSKWIYYMYSTGDTLRWHGPFLRSTYPQNLNSPSSYSLTGSVFSASYQSWENKVVDWESAEGHPSMIVYSAITSTTSSVVMPATSLTTRVAYAAAVFPPIAWYGNTLTGWLGDPQLPSPNSWCINYDSCNNTCCVGLSKEQRRVKGLEHAGTLGMSLVREYASPTSDYANTVSAHLSGTPYQWSQDSDHEMWAYTNTSFARIGRLHYSETLNSKCKNNGVLFDGYDGIARCRCPLTYVGEICQWQTQQSIWTGPLEIYITYSPSPLYIPGAETLESLEAYALTVPSTVVGVYSSYYPENVFTAIVSNFNLMRSKDQTQVFSYSSSSPIAWRGPFLGMSDSRTCTDAGITVRSPNEFVSIALVNGWSYSYFELTAEWTDGSYSSVCAGWITASLVEAVVESGPTTTERSAKLVAYVKSNSEPCAWRGGWMGDINIAGTYTYCVNVVSGDFNYNQCQPVMDTCTGCNITVITSMMLARARTLSHNTALVARIENLGKSWMVSTYSTTIPLQSGYDTSGWKMYYFGQNEIKRLPCGPSGYLDCRNGGSCVNNYANVATCVCATGWQGERCEFRHQSTLASSTMNVDPPSTRLRFGSLCSPLRNYCLTLGSDGNMVLYGPGGMWMWSSRTSGPVQFILSYTGVMSLKSEGDNPVTTYWSRDLRFDTSLVSEYLPWSLTVNDIEPYMSVYAQGVLRWWASDHLLVNARFLYTTDAPACLVRGNELSDLSGTQYLKLCSNGNLVLYTRATYPAADTVLWTSNTAAGSTVDYRVCLQSDGRLTISLFNTYSYIFTVPSTPLANVYKLKVYYTQPRLTLRDSADNVLYTLFN